MLLRQRATIGLMAATGLVTLAILVSGNVNNAATSMGFIPARVAGIIISPALPTWLTPLSATLVHAGVLHLVMNFVLFAFCGRQVESVLGAGPLIVLYALGAYGAAAGQFALNPSSTAPMIGASGAISAIVGAYAMSFGKPKRIVDSLRINRWLNIAWLMVAWVVIQVMMGYLMGLQGVLIAVGAHIGGFIVGVLLQKPLLLWRYRKA